MRISEPLSLSNPHQNCSLFAMKLPQQFFLVATFVIVFILGPLMVINPFLCESDSERFATPAFAEEAKKSNFLCASCIAILSASLAPLADALFDLLRYFRGQNSEKSPYTLRVDNTSSAYYLAERLSVISVFDVMALMTISVTSMDNDYDPAFVYNVLTGASMTMYLASAALYVSILRTSGGTVVTDSIAFCAFSTRLGCSLAYYWGCSPVAWNVAVAAELATVLFLYALIFRDYLLDNGDNMEKSYLCTVAFTYASAYVTMVLALVITASVSSGLDSAVAFRFIYSLYISTVCTYLASPKWREELGQTLRLRKTVRDLDKNIRARNAKDLRKETKATIAAMAKLPAMAPTPEGNEDDEKEDAEDEDETISAELKKKTKPSFFLKRFSRSLALSATASNSVMPEH